jgi:shikimate dehydrogenase
VPIGGSTRVAGVIGWPIAHSLSPAMHNAGYRALGLDWAYVPVAVPPDRLAVAIRGLGAASFAGLNVTIPHKEESLALASGASDVAREIGAANTLTPDGRGGFTADNTDAVGFERAVDEVAPAALDGARALLLGAGGSAQAVAWALSNRGCHVTVANRTPGRAARLGEVIPFEASAIDQAASSSGVIVNATSLGMGADGPPPELPLDSIQPGAVVVDLVYAPGGTPWLRAAEAEGATAVDGRGMLLHQGAASFSIWTGLEAPLEAMRAALEQPAA